MSNVEDLTATFLEEAPDAAAEVLQELALDEGAALLEAVPARLAAPVLDAMIPWQAARLLEAARPARVAMILRQLAFMDTTTLARLMRPEARQPVFDELPSRYAQRLENSLRYPLHQVGAWIDADIPILSVEQSVADALRVLRGAGPVSHVFLETADHGRYVGLVTVREVMRSPVTRRLDELECDATRPLSNRALLTSVGFDARWDDCLHLPVTGRRGNLLGGLSRKTLREALSEQHAGHREQQHAVAFHMLAALFVTINGLLRVVAESIGLRAAGKD